MDNSWKQDPRLKAMNKDKLAMLTEFAERIEHSDKNNLMEVFMTINMEARQKGVQFNDRETDLLVNILSSRMPPSEKKKIDLLKMLSKKWQGRADGAPASALWNHFNVSHFTLNHFNRSKSGAITILVRSVADCTSSFALSWGRRIQPAEPLSLDAVKQ